MRELSLNILDIVQNSVVAGAKKVEISVLADTKSEFLTIAVKDDGCGMSDEFLSRVIDPFTTTRTTRKVGMGIPLLKMAAECTGGSLEIDSEEGKGTNLSATFGLYHIDRVPLGDLTSTMVTLIGGSPEIRFVLNVGKDENVFSFDTAEIKEILGDVPLDEPEVLQFIRDFLNENILTATGGSL